MALGLRLKRVRTEKRVGLHADTNVRVSSSTSACGHGRCMPTQQTPLPQTHTHTRLTALFPGLYTRVCRYQKRKTNLDFTEARDSE